MTENRGIQATYLFCYNYVQHNILVSENTAVKHLLHSQLLKALSIYTNQIQIQCIDNQKIPLYKGRDNSRVLYISGLALQLSKSHNQKAMELASGISFQLAENCNGLFSVQVVPPGWIYLELTHSLLAAWLQSLVEQGSREKSERRKPQIGTSLGDATRTEGAGEQGSRGAGEDLLIEYPQNHISGIDHLFAVQYAHARCCSLMMLAHREELIQLGELLLSDTRFNLGSMIAPNPIPWLDSDEQLRLSHPAEGLLIAELVKVVDDLEFPDSRGVVNWQKIALDLSQAFEVFWRDCRIWGEVKISSPELAQARLGLVIITQSVLRFLLVEKLRLTAPWEL